jgi:DNA-binding MarR family transcriptional regulator
MCRNTSTDILNTPIKIDIFMSKTRKENFIRALQKARLAYDEAILYFALIQYGKRGAYASELGSDLNLFRTTVHSKMTRMVAKGYAWVKQDPLAPWSAKRFVATSPTELFQKTLQEMKQERTFLENVREQLGTRLEQIFSKSVVYGPDDLDSFLQPYLLPLLENGWKLMEQDVESTQSVFAFKIYACTLLPPNTQLIKDSGFIALQFDHTIEEDQVTLNFVNDLLKRHGREEILEKRIGAKDVRISSSEIEFFGKTFPSLKMEFLFDSKKEYQELTCSVVISIHSRMFYLWAESYPIVEEMVKAIFRAEKIPLT